MTSTAPAPDAHQTMEAARAALPEAVFSLPVFQPLEAAKAYVGALNIMSLNSDLDDHVSKPMYRLVCDVTDILDEIGEELHAVWVLARRATGMPDLPDDGNGAIEEAAGDVGGPNG